MSTILHIFIFLSVICMNSTLPSGDTYTAKYDSINIDSFLTNRRLIDTYVKCLLDQGRCNEVGKILKDVLPEALISECAKCTDIQRRSVDKVMRHLIKEHRSDFEALTKKYDPTGEFRQKYQKYLQMG